MRKSKYTDEVLIEFIEQHKHLRRIDIQNEHRTMYQAIRNRGLLHLLPPKTTRSGGIAGEGIWAQVYKERAENKPKRNRSVKNVVKPTEDRERPQTPKLMYKSYKIDDNTYFCGRCQQERTLDKFNGHTKTLCSKCYNKVGHYMGKDQDTNPWNVKDYYCNSVVNVSESQKFEIGIKVEPRLQEWLTKIGYQFIFKRFYNEKHIK